MPSTKPKEPTASAVSSLSDKPHIFQGIAHCPRCAEAARQQAAETGPVPLSEAPLYDVAKRAHEEKQAAFQAVTERAEARAAEECQPCAHRWKRCSGCGHPQHPKKCRELTTPGSPGDVDECGCLELVSARGIAMRCADSGGCPEHPASTSDEPPLTPEEEETLPPQPVRRPPYAVAYSVDGHLYEVALPGDATVTAVDGALVIKHGAGQVAGIVGIQPIESKEAD